MDQLEQFKVDYDTIRDEYASKIKQVLDDFLIQKITQTEFNNQYDYLMGEQNGKCAALLAILAEKQKK